MGAAWYRARAGVRRRWRANLLLVLVVGLAGGVVLTTLAGARRASTAYERFRDETLAVDLDIAFDGAPRGDLDAAFQEVAALAEVEAATRTAFPFVVPAGSGFYPYLDFLAVVGLDDSFGHVIDRPRVLDGRAPSPDAAAEAAIIETYAQEAGLEVGDRVEFESFAPDQLEALFTTGDAGPPAGPRVTLDITGIFDAPSFLSESTGDFVPRVFLSRAFADVHADDVATYPGGFAVRLHNGDADVASVSAQLRDRFDASTNLELTPASEIDRKIATSIDVIVTALLVCAVVAAVAGCVAVTQALVRHFLYDISSDRALATLGMTRRERLATKGIATTPVAVGGALGAVIIAIAASPLMPVGAARRAEPDPGVSVDLPVLALGGLAIALVVFGLAGLAAIAVRSRERIVAGRETRSHDERVMPALRRTSLPLPATTGIGMVVAPRSGTAWPVRSALGGVAFGVAGLTAILVFAASVTRLVDSPDRFGAPFDAVISGFSGDVLEEGGDQLIADPDVRRLGVLTTGLARISGAEVNSHSLESLKGDMAPTLLDGRLPSAPGEAVVGSETLASAGAALGGTVTIDGAASSLDATVVGTAAFPVIDERSSAGRGVLLMPADLVRISAEDELNADVLVKWADGIDAAAARAALAERTGTEVSPPRLPSDVNNLREVESLPRTIAILLAALAALSAVHALVSTVRMRRHDLAVLRMLGFERRQVRSTISWQATTISAVGLAVGIPLGIVVGRVVWRALAGEIGVVDEPVVPVLAIGALAIATLVVANLAALVPGRRASKLRPAAELRASVT